MAGVFLFFLFDIKLFYGLGCCNFYRGVALNFSQRLLLKLLGKFSKNKAQCSSPLASGLSQGGGFLIDAIEKYDIFIPEEANEEERSLAGLAHDFSVNEVLPKSADIEAGKQGITPALLKKAGELGFLMAEVASQYGGLGMGKVPTTFISENITHQGSFTVAFMCHTGIAMLPLRAYGTHDQKQKYLPRLATGEMIGAYALTEPGAGSDAMGGKAHADLSPDGRHYILNGEKTFITNGGFADLFTVFAKVGGDKLTAFLVERSFPGVSIGPEEHKMGIHGSSTTPLILNNAMVPIENVLGEIGKGHRIAFNVLNVGRWKLGAACVSTCKRLMEKMIPYAKARQQFSTPIASFPLIRDKIATAAILTYHLESIIYRFARTLDAAIETLDRSSPDFDAKREGFLKEYAVEASIAKVYGSECLDTVADESVQVLGGYGFCADYEVERFYRDSRINRIFEGTNEINRLIITNTLVKRAFAGELPLLQRLEELHRQLKNGFPEAVDVALGREIQALARLKDLAIYLAGLAVEKYKTKLESRQMVVAFISDVIIQAYALESGLLRARKIRAKFGEEKAKIAETMVTVAIAEQVSLLSSRARQVLMNIADGNEKDFVRYAKDLDLLVPKLFVNTEKLRDIIAAKMLEVDGYRL
ncbi:MAG: acyl-CoA dehydrogenase family protein [Deltaproteobacteria bacterium]|nr:acyl-CoA dehydrogenase family protein [Deltaproteobacteria bacterium]